MTRRLKKICHIFTSRWRIRTYPASQRMKPPLHLFGILILSILFLVSLYASIWLSVRQLYAYGTALSVFFSARSPPPLHLLSSLPFNCSAIVAGDSADIAAAKKWTFDSSRVLDQILKNRDRCSLYHELFGFHNESLSEEEASFPLAYGILVHSDFVQVMLMLSAFYHPQNAYCFAVSSLADNSFLRLIHGLPDCFDNVHVIQAGPMEWGNYEIIKAVNSCMAKLDSLDHKWRYFQYLSGVDAPLRTNLEMVRIFRTLNGSVNAEVKEFQNVRYQGKKPESSPLPLYKSSVSSLMPRAAIHVLVTNPRALDLLRFLDGIKIPDEAYWATVAGNPKLLPLAGGWNATAIIKARLTNKTDDNNGLPVICEHPPCITRYYISRYQVWYEAERCKGVFIHSSCAFGVEDVASLVKQPELVVHKLRMNVQPAALFCLLQELTRRSESPDPHFNYVQYARLPQVELAHGVPYEKLSRPDWIY